VGTFSGKRIGIPTENDRLGTQCEESVHVTEALDKPTAEETRASGDEYAPTPHFVPEVRCVPRDQIEVFRGNLHGEATPGVAGDEN
jgi:hypothetical protein